MTILSKKWRLNNLYRIIDKNANSIPLHLNPMQSDVLDNLHTRNLILKGRQIGMSTFAVLYLLDTVLFNENISAGIVSYSLEHAQHIFKKIIGHALDTLPKEIRHLSGVLSRSAREISFNNGSSLRVDTTLRGGSYPLVLVSEFGKTCARNPLKAEEVITGTLQSVPKNGSIIIESTAEGSDGFFCDLVNSATLRGNDNLNEMEYRLFFYPWFSDENNAITTAHEPIFDPKQNDYFKKIDPQNKLTLAQKHWYCQQEALLGDRIKREFPSNISEAFASSSDAYYFGEAINEAYNTNRCLYTSIYDALLPVYVAMDIGVNDLTVMVFFQIAHGEVRIIDYYEDNNKGVDFYAKFLLQDKKYLYHTIFLPHDSTKRDPLDTTNTYERDFRRLFSSTGTRFHVLKRIDKQISISHAKIMINRCVFNISRVKSFLDQLSKYRKKWNEQQGRYVEDPQHNEASNFGDCFQYVSQAVAHIETAGNVMGSLEKHKKAVESRLTRIY